MFDVVVISVVLSSILCWTVVLDLAGVSFCIGVSEDFN